MPLKRIAVVTVIVVAGLAAAGIVVASGWTPTVPADAASAVIARTAVDGRTSSGCLDQVERDGGRLDLCWHAYRQQDGDPAKDYYLLRVVGTLHGEDGGVRWSAIRARLVDAPAADAVFDGWPSDTIDGPCEARPISVSLGPNPANEEVCGRTSGEFISAWNYRVTWTCVGCVVPDRSARPVALYFSVAVPEGRVPNWEIGADFGR